MSNYPYSNHKLPTETKMSTDQEEALDRVQAAHRDYRHILDCYVAVLEQRGRKATATELESFLEGFADFLTDAVDADVRMLADAGYEATCLPKDHKQLLQEFADRLAEGESPLFAQVKGMVRAHDAALLHSKLGSEA